MDGERKGRGMGGRRGGREGEGMEEGKGKVTEGMGGTGQDIGWDGEGNGKEEDGGEERGYSPAAGLFDLIQNGVGYSRTGKHPSVIDSPNVINNHNIDLENTQRIDKVKRCIGNVPRKSKVVFLL